MGFETFSTTIQLFFMEGFPWDSTVNRFQKQRNTRLTRQEGFPTASEDRRAVSGDTAIVLPVWQGRLQGRLGDLDGRVVRLWLQVLGCRSVGGGGGAPGARLLSCSVCRPLRFYSAHRSFQGPFGSTKPKTSLFFFSEMSLPFSLNIHASPTDYAQIRKYGFIKCDFTHPHLMTPMQLGYCVHCKRLFSLSWAKEHSRRLRRKVSDLSTFFNDEKVALYCFDISSELEIRMGKSLLSTTQPNGNSPPHLDQSDGEQICQGALNDPLDLPRDHLPCSSPSVHYVPDIAPTSCDSDGINSEQTFECALDCILKDSFRLSEFDGEMFLSLAQSIMDKLFSRSDETNITNFKARIITSVVRRMAIILSLSKTQNDQLISFLKTMIQFIRPKSREIATKIHASYSTCLRRCLRDKKAGKTLCRKYMEECACFQLRSILLCRERTHHLVFCPFRIRRNGRTNPSLFCRLLSNNWK